MKSLLFIVSAIAIFAGAASQCVYDPIPACRQLDFGRNNGQYTGNPCDSNTFYQCTRNGRGFSASLQRCPVCLDWSPATLTCSISNGLECPTEAPITEIVEHVLQYCFLSGNGPNGLYVGQYRDTTDHLGYYWRVFDNEVLMPCAPGTYFDFGACRCLACYEDGPCVGAGSPLVFTLDFDNRGSERGIYYDTDPSAQLSLAGQDGSALVFDGVSSDIEVPFFQNNEFRQFRFDGYFNRDSAGGNGEQGILFHGGSPQAGCWPPGVYVISTNSTSLRAGIVTDDGTFDIVRNNVANTDVWTHVVLRYDGSSLSFSVNDDAGVSIAASGVTVRNICNLYFGRSVDVNGVAHLFRGRLDTLSWYREA